jgi:hypothetical protein
MTSADKSRRFLCKEQLEAEILTHLRAQSECGEITYVSVKPTGFCPPQPTWDIAGIARRTVCTSARSRTFMLEIVNGLQGEVDLVPPSEGGTGTG